MNATTVAFDLATSVFQLTVADAHWRSKTHRLTRMDLGMNALIPVFRRP